MMHMRDIKVESMYRVVHAKSEFSHVAPIYVADGSIVIVDAKSSKADSVYVFVRLVLGELTTSVWHPDESFPIHPSVLEEID